MTYFRSLWCYGWQIFFITDKHNVIDFWPEFLYVWQIFLMINDNIQKLRRHPNWRLTSVGQKPSPYIRGSGGRISGCEFDSRKQPNLLIEKGDFSYL